MIELRGISKTVETKQGGTVTLFSGASVSIPENKRILVLGRKFEGKSTLLRLIGKSEEPDLGRVWTSLHFSPVVNTKRMFNARFSVYETLLFFARIYGVDVQIFSQFIGRNGGMNILTAPSITSLSGNEKAVLEALVVAVLPFDCYLVDDIHQIPGEKLQVLLDLAEKRRSTVIMTTHLAQYAKLYADGAVVIANKTLAYFDQVDEALDHYEKSKHFANAHRG